MSTVVAVKTAKKPSLGDKVSQLYKAIKKAFTPEAEYPHTPGNVEVEATSDLIADIHAMGFKDYETLLAFLNAAVTGTINDNDLLLENLIRLLAKLPQTSKAGKQLTDGLLTQLWGTLDHPPYTSTGFEYRYRAADGSGNNIHQPLLGAANTPYARTVSPMTFQSPNPPDPDVIFDSLMARGDTFTPHPQGISSMLFYLATIIIHDIFQTALGNFDTNLTSSYLDLSPLYGRNQEEQNAMRTHKDGLLKPDCFSSRRIVGFPPGCGVFLIMFNRFHNYVVTQLAGINENGRFTKPQASARLSGAALDDAWKKYDNDLFQTGRLITCGLFVNIVLKDYVRTILALNRTTSTWDLDPRSKAGKNILSQPSPQGVGNQVSVEFNLIYRWHSSISQKDEQWTIKEFQKFLGGKDPSKASLSDMLRGMAALDASIPEAPEKRTLGNLSRRADGTFDDDALVKILQESVEDVAGSFGANRVPNCMKAVEMLGIIQSRYWNVATLNEFRAFVGLTKHTTFEDINPDPVVARKLKDLYDSPDAVELYPGVVAEKPKPPMSPGSGLCVNYTTSRAILSDAVALVRGDRFYTLDYTSKNLTNWGYNEANFDLTVNQGHVMHKLIFRAFPDHFAQNSIYAHFPFVTPTENKTIHDSLETSDKYSWDTPKRKAQTVFIRSHEAVMAILSNKKDFKVTWGEAMQFGASPEGTEHSGNFCLAGDNEGNAANREQNGRALYGPPHWADELRAFCDVKTAQLLKKYRIPVVESGEVKQEVDIVRDVLGLVTTHTMAAMFSLPLRTSSSPHGIYTEHELFGVLFAVFALIFFDVDVANSFKLRETAQTLSQQLGGLIALNARAGKLADLVHEVERAVNANGHADPEPSLPSFGNKLIAHIVEQAGSVEQAVWGSIIFLVASGTANQTQLLSQCLDYYLGPGFSHMEELHRLAHLHTKDADEKLMRYMLEGSRLRGTVALYRDVAADVTIRDYAPCEPDPAHPGVLDPVPISEPKEYTLHLTAGTRLVLDLTCASHDPAAFPDPETVRLDRPLESYVHYGWGSHRCLGMETSRVMMTAIFKAVVGLKGLARAPAPRGELKSVPVKVWSGQVRRDEGAGEQAWSGLRAYMTPDQSSYWPIPTTMRVRFEE